MEQGFIESHIRRSNRNLIVIGLVLTIIGAGLAFVSWVPALIAVPGLIALGCWLKRELKPTAHPIYKRLAIYGEPHLLAQQINREFAGIKSSNTTQFSANWLAQGDTYGLSLVPWSDIVWVYVDIRTRGGIRSSCYVRVWSRNGKQLVAATGVLPGEAEQLFEELRVRAPWAEAGYSAELLQEWNKRRAEFIARVDARKKSSRQSVATKGASAYAKNL